MRAEFCFQLGDPIVEKTVVVAGGVEPILKPFDFLGELPDLLFEGGVLGDQSLNSILGYVSFQIADFADQFSDGVALREDFVVGGLETIFGVECAFTP